MICNHWMFVKYYRRMVWVFFIQNFYSCWSVIDQHHWENVGTYGHRKICNLWTPKKDNKLGRNDDDRHFLMLSWLEPSRDHYTARGRRNHGTKISREDLEFSLLLNCPHKNNRSILCSLLVFLLSVALACLYRCSNDIKKECSTLVILILVPSCSHWKTIETFFNPFWTRQQ